MLLIQKGSLQRTAVLFSYVLAVLTAASVCNFVLLPCIS